MYFKDGRVKVAVALPREKEYDKRETIKRREIGSAKLARHEGATLTSAV